MSAVEDPLTEKTIDFDCDWPCQCFAAQWIASDSFQKSTFSEK